jgi:hypothetical protein
MNLEAWWNTNIKIPLPWVRTLPPSYWLAQKIGDPHGSDKYKDLQPESYAMFKAIHQVASPKSFLFDVGCQGGRHMKALQRRGYGHVTGLDVRPCLHALQGTFEAVLPTLPTHAFDVVFTFGMTIELVPPSFPICHHMARIAKKAVVLMVIEKGVPYPRLYQQEFAREGFTLTTYKPCGGHHLWVFERR